MNLIVVDDQNLFREGLVSMLIAQPDIQVVGEADSMHQAVDKVLEAEPNIVLIDLDLFDGDGIEAMRAILARRPETKVVILTIQDSYEKVKLAILSGAKGYLLKSLPIAKILASLRAVERGEIALPRSMMSRLLAEFTRLGIQLNYYQASLSGLTVRELEVLRLLGYGLTNRQIADRLQIAENTVKIHVRNIYEKLRLRNRLEALMFARRAGLVSNEMVTRI